MPVTAELPPLGVNYNDPDSVAELSSRVGSNPLEMSHVDRGASDQKPRADRMLNRLGALLPARYRQAMVGDLFEDVSEMRASGTRESTITRYVAWQVLIALTLVPSETFYRAYRRVNPLRWLSRWM